MHIDRERITKTFLELIAIDSPSGHEHEVSDYICKKFSDLHVEHKLDEYGNVIAYVPGMGKSLLLAAHMDTVDPGRNISAKVLGDRIVTNGDTILGADDKAGISEILCAIEYLKKNPQQHRPLEIVFTREEEIGLVGAQKLNRRYITAEEGLVIDKSGPVQTVVIAAPFIMTIDVEIEGIAAHAGTPDHGVSAIKIAADAIAKIKVGRIDVETTANVGVIAGGTIRNGVPSHVAIKAEVRSHVAAKAERVTEKMKETFFAAALKHGGKVRFHNELACAGYKHAANDPFVKQIADVWSEMGEQVKLEKAGGASDANEFAKWGIKVVDMGYGGINPHTTNEEVKISDMQLVSEFIINFVRTTQ